jgi:hypothetical protein
MDICPWSQHHHKGLHRVSTKAGQAGNLFPRKFIGTIQGITLSLYWNIYLRFIPRDENSPRDKVL